jgi:hypothetical protein
VLIEYVTLNYLFAYFWIAISLSYQLFIHVCSEANFNENYFSVNFSSFFTFQCETSRHTCSWVWMLVALSIYDLTVCHPDEYVPRSDASPLLSLPFAQHCIFLLFLSCCVFLSWISPKILAFSEHLFSFHDILCVFLCSFKFLCFLEYWNICWLEYFLEILCMKIIFYLSVNGVDIDISVSFGLMYLLM